MRIKTRSVGMELGKQAGESYYTNFKQGLKYVGDQPVIRFVILIAFFHCGRSWKKGSFSMPLRSEPCSRQTHIAIIGPAPCAPGGRVPNRLLPTDVKAGHALTTPDAPPLSEVLGTLGVRAFACGRRAPRRRASVLIR